MVKSWILIALFCVAPMFLNATDVTVSIASAIEMQPIEGIITIIHDSKENVDLNSFQLDKKPLKVSFIQDKKGQMLISTYHFQLDGLAKGLYLLPAVSVKVGNKIYNSPSTTFTVSGIEAASANFKGNLRLVTTITPSQQAYPGQRLLLTYRIYYRSSIDLTEEQLPLLDAKGFEKIGQKEIKDSIENDSNVQEISQQIRVLTPGTFNFPPSIIEGFAYEVNEQGVKTYQQPKLYSETPAITIEGLTFPKEGRPGSFDNTIGQYIMKIEMLTPKEVSVGDNIRLSLQLLGTGEFATVNIPELSCQPGFSGFFQINDLPAETKLEEGSKSFKVELRPLNSSITEIPPIEFSFFDTASKSYSILRSNPIPIIVKELKTASKEKRIESQKLSPSDQEWKELWSTPQPLNISSDYSFSTDSTYASLIKSWSALWVIPFGLFLLLFQKLLRRYFENQERSTESVTLFQDALQTPSEFFAYLEKALLLRLWEKGIVTKKVDSIESLPDIGLGGEVRSFLYKVDAARFSGNKAENLDALLEEAKTLFKKI